MYGFLRTACVVPDLIVADPYENSNEIIKALDETKKTSSDFIIFPELCLTGYSCQDLFFQNSLLEGALLGLKKILKKSAQRESFIVVGLPLKLSGKLYNCALILFDGKVLGIVPKSYIGEDGPLPENRWFSSGLELKETSIHSSYLGIREKYDIPIGTNLIFSPDDSVSFAVVIGNLSSSPVPKSSILALSGAELVINISAEISLAGNKKRCFLKNHSKNILSSLVYVSSGCKESTQDMVFSGYSSVSECGKVLKESSTLPGSGYILYADTDIERVRAKRQKNFAFKNSLSLYSDILSVRNISLPPVQLMSDGSLLCPRKSPFIPQGKEERIKLCTEIFNIQTEGLKKRLEHTGLRPVIGISGGLDSTLSLLVCAKAIKDLGLAPDSICGLTMPGFGTSERTYTNSLKLMDGLKISSKEINIKNACLSHFEDIGHDGSRLDLTFENAQARERTQVLMDYAGKVGGLVVGTGDLSELVLGWCTYNGDQMSMYGVNAGVPKTLIKWVIDAVIENKLFPECSEVLKDIIDTPISPELLPPDKSGKISQETESLVGPYILHDFFIYYVLKYGFSPDKVYYLALLAFKDMYDKTFILKWLKTFYRRFFTQQFKRSCMPDGVKVLDISLSPRNGLCMPSDASFKLWEDMLDKI